GIADLAAVVGATPGRASESARRALGERRVRRQARFERLERRADVVAQRFEPRSRARFVSVEQALAHKTSVLGLGHDAPAVTIAHAMPSRRGGWICSRHALRALA